ncbi:Transcriptional adapter ada2 [Irineochytrium annulatum]|nr:Transcriptional adapter ada2 [Irineochytrium annulatum]
MTGISTDAKNDDEFSHKYHCDSCSKDLSNLVRITCAECVDPETKESEIDFCVDCFASGAEVKNHKKHHAYMVKECLDFPIFHVDWTAQEELLLVDSLKMFGLGNWEQISDHIGTKTKEEVEKHYMDDMTTIFDKAVTRKTVLKDPNPIVRKPFRACTSGPANHEIAGFMPAREEFETEYDNEAETYVKDMTFDENDPEDEVSLKTTILNIYNTALDRRIERKKFIKDRGLTFDFRRIQANEKKRTKEEKDLLNRVRVFSKLQTSADFDKFVEGLTNEQRLRQRISQLQEYRRMGITTFKEAHEYDRDKMHRMGGRRTAQPLEIGNSDGVELLLPNERQLCSSLRILPRAYLVIKETLLREYAAKGGLKRREAREIIKIDVNKTSQIYDLFVTNGWVKDTGP